MSASKVVKFRTRPWDPASVAEATLIEHDHFNTWTVTVEGREVGRITGYEGRPGESRIGKSMIRMRPLAKERTLWRAYRASDEARRDQIESRAEAIRFLLIEPLR